MTAASYSAGRDRVNRTWTPVVTIEGVGDSGGLFYFCLNAPAFAAGNANWKPWLVPPWPNAMPERIDPLGGIAEPGELEFAVLDFEDGFTNFIGSEQSPITFANEEIDISETSIDVLSASQIAVDDVIYIGAEAMRVTAISTNTLTVTRGYLDTDAQVHDNESPVFEACHYLRSRRMRLYWCPLDAVDFTAAQEKGQYFLDQLELSDDFNSWVIRGRSQLKYFSRLVGRVQRKSFLLNDPSVSQEFALLYGVPNFDKPTEHWPDEYIFLKNENEVVSLRFVSGGGETDGLIERRQLCATPKSQLDERIEGTQELTKIATQVYAAGISSRSLDGSFRFSPGPTPSEDRSSGTWTASAHWCDIILCLLTSAADDDDGLELVNYLGSGSDAVRSNWSSLPPGVGIGVPVDLVDIASFLAVKQRTQDALFPAFYCGDEAVEFGELITKHFLKPLGAYLSYSSGQARIVLPRSIIAGASSFSIGPSDILVRQVGTGKYMPRIRSKQDMSRLAGSVVYKCKTSTGDPATITITDKAFAGTYGQRGYYSTDEGAITIDAPSFVAGIDGSQGVAERAATQRLFRFRRPPLDLNFDVDINAEDLDIGDIGTLTFNEIPDLSRRIRGVDGLSIEVIGKEPVLNPDEDAHVKVSCFGYASAGRIGRVFPSAEIVSSTTSGGNRVITVTANEYTAPDAVDDLPASDAEAFAVGDYVYEYSRDGGTAIGSARIVTAIGTNQITISGTTAVTNGNILSAAEYVYQSAEQTAEFVSFGDKTDNDIAGGEPVWQYGEP